MRTHVLIGIATASLVAGLVGQARAADVRHSPDAHMNQNDRRYTYEYDDGVCWYSYEYDFKTLKDHLDQKGDCRDVPIERYRPQAAIAPAYPPPAAAPPIAAPGQAAVQVAPTVIAPQAAPSVTVGPPTAATAPRAPAGITVAPVP
jgi:hypothetical protein